MLRYFLTKKFMHLKSLKRVLIGSLLGVLLSVNTFSFVAFATEEIGFGNPAGISVSTKVITPGSTMGLHFFDTANVRQNVSHGDAVYLPEGWVVQLKKCNSLGASCNTLVETYTSSNLGRDMGGLYTFPVPTELGKYNLILRNNFDSYVDLQGFEVAESPFFVINDHAVASGQTVHIYIYDSAGQPWDLTNVWGTGAGQYVFEVFSNLGSGTNVHVAGGGVSLSGSATAMTRVDVGHYSFIAPSAAGEYYVGFSYGIEPTPGVSRSIDSDSFDVVAGMSIPSEDPVVAGVPGTATDPVVVPDPIDSDPDLGDDYVCDPGEQGPLCDGYNTTTEDPVATATETPYVCDPGEQGPLCDDATIEGDDTAIDDETTPVVEGCIYKLNSSTGKYYCYKPGETTESEDEDEDDDERGFSVPIIARAGLLDFNFIDFDNEEAGDDFDFESYDYDKDSDDLVGEDYVCSDLEGHWGNELITDLLEKNMYPTMTVDGKTMCRPSQELSKKALMAWLLITFHKTLAEQALTYEVTSENNPYFDLDNDDPFAPYVVVATKAGIVSGKSNCAAQALSIGCTFGGDEVVKRAEILKMVFESSGLYEGTEVQQAELDSMFPDKAPSELFEDEDGDSAWYSGYLHFAASHYIINGVQLNGKFYSQMDGGLTFAQAAKILTLSMEVLEQ